MAEQAKAVLKTETLDAVADRGYFSSSEILACHEAGITVTLPKPQTSGAKSERRFGEQDFAYLPEEDAYRCPAGERLPCRYTRRRRQAATDHSLSKLFAARPGQSGGLRDGSMSICSRMCSSGLMQTTSHASALRNGRASVRHDEGPHVSDTLPHQNASKSSC